MVSMLSGSLSLLGIRRLIEKIIPMVIEIPLLPEPSDSFTQLMHHCPISLLTSTSGFAFCIVEGSVLVAWSSIDLAFSIVSSSLVASALFATIAIPSWLSLDPSEAAALL